MRDFEDGFSDRLNLNIVVQYYITAISDIVYAGIIVKSQLIENQFLLYFEPEWIAA
jgi:hypothetical protein